MDMDAGTCRLQLVNVVWGQLSLVGNPDYLKSGVVNDPAMPACLPSRRDMHKAPKFVPKDPTRILRHPSGPTGSLSRRSLKDAIRAQVSDPALARHLRLRPARGLIENRRNLPAGEC